MILSRLFRPSMTTSFNKSFRNFPTYRRKPKQIIQNEKLKAKTVDEYSKEGHQLFASASEIPDEIIDFPCEDESQKIKTKIVHADCKELLGLNYELYEETPQIKKLIEQTKSSTLRERSNLFLLEGWRLISEALSSNLKPKAILFTRKNLLSRMASMQSLSKEEYVDYLNELPLYKMPYKSMQTWSSLTTSPGIMGLFKLSEAKQLCHIHKEQSFPLTLILDNVRDPSNLGAIMRTAAGAGVEKILLTKGCCDIWDSKVLRAACGAHFHVDVTNTIEWSWILSYIEDYPSVFLADYSDIGSKEESNFEFDSDLFLSSEEEPITILNDEGRQVNVDQSYLDKNHLNLFQNVELPLASYSSVNYFTSINDKSNCVLIIGGETGLSNSAKKFTFMNKGTKVSIPMSNGIESLNSSIASAILIYEIKRQFCNLK